MLESFSAIFQILQVIEDYFRNTTEYIDTHTHVELSQQFLGFVHVIGFWNMRIVVMSIAEFEEFIL